MTTLLDRANLEAQIRLMGAPDPNDPKARVRDAVLLIDHGSRRSEANAVLDEVAGLVKKRLGSGSIVEAAHMEIAEPTIAQGFARCVAQGATMVVAHPFMLARGRHVSEDLPRLVAEAAAPYPAVAYTLTAPLGSHPAVVDAVIERCQAAASGSEHQKR